MTEEDVVFLKSYNQKQPASSKLSEDDFEKIMEVYEETAFIKTPFASIDQTVASYDEMLQGLQELNSANTMNHAKEIYEYWKSRRQALGNKPLHPTLKFETHAESDDMDPYVCFRRREVRQTRKTRARDVQSADKLKRLRKELDDGRQLVLAAHNRELLKYEMLKMDRQIFELRASLKEQKVRLNIKTDDEDLINQKVSQALFVPVCPPSVILTTRSHRRGRPQRRQLYSDHLLRRSFGCQEDQMLGLRSTTYHSWQTGLPKRRTNSVLILRRRCKTTGNGTATMWISPAAHCLPCMGQGRIQILDQRRHNT